MKNENSSTAKELQEYDIECFFNSYSSIQATIKAESLEKAIEIAKEKYPECRSFIEADHWR